MLLKLMAFHGECCRLLVQNEVFETGYFFYKNKIGPESILIWHHNGNLIIRIQHYPSSEFDNDLTVTFKSKVPYSDFCEQFSNSEYNDKNKYNFFTHNCSNAVQYALNLAGINLEIGRIKMMYLIRDSLFMIPGPFLSPLRLYYEACAQKAHQLAATSKNNRPLACIDFKLQLTQKTLFFGTKKNPVSEKTRLTNFIGREVERLIQQNPHKSEFYLQVLTATTELLSKNTGKRNFTDFKALTKSCSHRGKQTGALYLQLYLDAIMGGLFRKCAALFLIGGNASDYLVPTKRILEYTFAAYMAYEVYEFYLALNNRDSQVIPTKLSKAMESLQSICEEEASCHNASLK